MLIRITPTLSSTRTNKSMLQSRYRSSSQAAEVDNLEYFDLTCRSLWWSSPYRARWTCPRDPWSPGGTSRASAPRNSSVPGAEDSPPVMRPFHSCFRYRPFPARPPDCSSPKPAVHYERPQNRWLPSLQNHVFAMFGISIIVHDIEKI